MMEFILSKVARIKNFNQKFYLTLLNFDQELYLKRTLFQVSIKSFTFILREQIKILKIFSRSLDDCFWVWP